MIHDKSLLVVPKLIFRDDGNIFGVTDKGYQPVWLYRIRKRSPGDPLIQRSALTLFEVSADL